MTSQGSQNSTLSGPLSDPLSGSLSLPLSKFSYATVFDDSTGPVPWTHVSTRGDLFAVFEDARSHSSQRNFRQEKSFRVIRDPEVMVGSTFFSTVSGSLILMSPNVRTGKSQP